MREPTPTIAGISIASTPRAPPLNSSVSSVQNIPWRAWIADSDYRQEQSLRLA